VAVDPLGWENGYWYDAPIDVDRSDGLSDAELDAQVSRTMARLELLRGQEFTEPVDVRVVTRAEHRQTAADWTTVTDDERRMTDQVWEALLVVGEDRDATEEFATLYGSNVFGYYDPETDELVVVSDGGADGELVVPTGTLVHELVHALQDQQYDLTRPEFQGRTHDERLAVGGLLEGEANYLMTQYLDRCGQWSCVGTDETGASAGGESDARPNEGLLYTVLQPYSDGPVYVDHLVRAGGWAAVTERYAAPPVATAQIVDPTAAAPASVAYDDTARNGWTRFDAGMDGTGADSVGEASIAVSFWYQASAYGAPAVDEDALFETTTPYDSYNYTNAPADGWAGDVLVPYANPTGGDDGYVWQTNWASAADAAEFREAYLTVLAAHGAIQVDRTTWVVADGPFADAFRVVSDGRTVTIVNAPSTVALDDVRPDLAGRA
jgi:hypothetical protein